MAAVRDAFKQQISGLGGAASSPLGALAAGLFSDTVHLAIPLLLRVEGLHCRLVNCSGPVAFSVNDCDPLLNVAVICAV